MRENKAMKKVFCYVLAIGYIFYAALIAVPVVNAATRVPVLRSSARLYRNVYDEYASAVVIDAATGKRLYSYLPNRAWPAASLTKLTNALVLLDQRPNWSRRVAFSSADEVGGGMLTVKNGTRITINDLFYSSIVASANNAAMALARTSGLGVRGFVRRMNSKARSLGLKKTVFYDPVGMDPRNVTTAAEMSVIARVAFSTYAIRRAATTMIYHFTTTAPYMVKTIKSTDRLLTRDPDMYVLGGKTGFLYESRYNLAVKMRTMDWDPSKPPLIVVVLGAPRYSGSFASAKALANWAWKSYRWISR